MRSTHHEEQNPNVLDTVRFQHHNGFFIIDIDCIITKNQIINVQEHYQLVDYTSGGGVELREVVFWHALLKGNYLKIIVYDIQNKIVIQRYHDLTKPKYTCDWFLLEEDFFEDDILEFGF
ncbi:MAG: hypothetical protein R6X28_13560 [Bacteroidales bacterium]